MAPPLESAPQTPADRRAVSYLVRLWHEADGTSEGQPVLRAFVRSLADGEELYANDPNVLARALVQGLSREGARSASSEARAVVHHSGAASAE